MMSWSRKCKINWCVSCGERSCKPNGSYCGHFGLDSDQCGVPPRNEMRCKCSAGHICHGIQTPNMHPYRGSVSVCVGGGWVGVRLSRNKVISSNLTIIDHLIKYIKAKQTEHRYIRKGFDNKTKWFGCSQVFAVHKLIKVRMIYIDWTITRVEREREV